MNQIAPHSLYVLIGIFLIMKLILFNIIVCIQKLIKGNYLIEGLFFSHTFINNIFDCKCQS